jgi:hypothetical protein
VRNIQRKAQTVTEEDPTKSQVELDFEETWERWHEGPSTWFKHVCLEIWKQARRDTSFIACVCPERERLMEEIRRLQEELNKQGRNNP